MDVTRRIGLSLGADLCWPICFEEILRRLDLAITIGSDTVRFDVDRVVIEPFDLRQTTTYDLVVGWAKGYLGKIFAISAFLVGCGFAAARQNPMPAIFGLVLALIIGFGPDLIESMLTATV